MTSTHNPETLRLMDATGPAAGWYFGSVLAWQKRAACATTPEPDSFFPGGRPSNKSKKQCLGCAVREQCLDWALVNEEHGIWGGLTEKERIKLLASKLPVAFGRQETKS